MSEYPYQILGDDTLLRLAADYLDWVWTCDEVYRVSPVLRAALIEEIERMTANPGLQATAATEAVGPGEAEQAAAPEPQC